MYHLCGVTLISVHQQGRSSVRLGIGYEDGMLPVASAQHHEGVAQGMYSVETVHPRACFGIGTLHIFV